jgi:DNA-binding response OmpR family regulator
MSNILLVEDEAHIRDLISYNLKKDGFQIIEADNANDALIVLEDATIDLILLDLMLPGLTGMQFLSILKRVPEHADIPVIIISARDTEKEIIAALEAGSDDYLTKPFSMNMLRARIKAIFRRGPKKEATSLSYSGINVDTGSHEVTVSGRGVSLTKKEFDLLTLFIQNPKQVYTRNQLLNSIWGYDTDVYTRTVDAHISSLRKKLGEKGHLIKSIPKIGYRID